MPVCQWMKDAVAGLRKTLKMRAALPFDDLTKLVFARMEGANQQTVDLLYSLLQHCYADVGKFENQAAAYGQLVKVGVRIAQEAKVPASSGNVVHIFGPTALN